MKILASHIDGVHAAGLTCTFHCRRAAFNMVAGSRTSVECTPKTVTARSRGAPLGLRRHAARVGSTAAQRGSPVLKGDVSKTGSAPPDASHPCRRSRLARKS